ncbi:MAG TPA: aldolase/citrate lyase family protein, partial [Vicinamibacterales bacterium]|nr:aldolase/citrate lyase family protein [Vicinamibacterales bacterium]
SAKAGGFRLQPEGDERRTNGLEFTAMDFPVNKFKADLKAGKQQVGLWSSLSSAAATEILSDSGFDWILIDTEHAPNETPMVADQLRAASMGTASPVVRPAWNDIVILKRLLDVGVQTLLVPFVQSPEEAARAVAATRYPPRGIRGVASVHRANRYGRVPDYFARANDEMCVLVQLETRAAVDALEAIAAVDGVDAIFIGPSDLAASLGYLGNNAHPEVRGTIEQACRRAQAIGKPIGILAPIEGDARTYLDMGFSYVAVGSDVVVLRKGCDALVKMFKGS